MFHCNILQRATAARSTTMLCWVLAACICAVSSFSVPATLRPAYTIVRRSVLDARCSAETEVWNRIPRRAQLAAWATSIITIAGNRAEAKQGDIPKFKGLGEITNEYVEDAIDRRKVGLYDENAKAEVIQRSKKVTKDFNKMSKEVDAALAQGRCSDAVAALSLRMGTVKGAMRELSRVAAGGDILVRRAEGKAPKFNFNDGTFEYKEIAQLPEDMFAALNRATGQCKAKDLEKFGEEWEAAKKIYTEWTALLEQM